MNDILLPHDPVALLTATIDALKQLRGDKRYRYSPRIAWHDPLIVACAHCDAGALIAVVLGAQPNETVIPSRCGVHNELALEAVGHFGSGLCGHAFGFLGLPRADGDNFSRTMPVEFDAHLAALVTLRDDIAVWQKKTQEAAP